MAVTGSETPSNLLRHIKNTIRFLFCCIQSGGLFHSKALNLICFNHSQSTSSAERDRRSPCSPVPKSESFGELGKMWKQQEDERRLTRPMSSWRQTLGQDESSVAGEFNLFMRFEIICREKDNGNEEIIIIKFACSLHFWRLSLRRLSRLGQSATKEDDQEENTTKRTRDY